MKKTKKIKNIKVNWHRVITLSAAGKYIQDRLDEELKKIKNK
jgi:hypothetical protein